MDRQFNPPLFAPGPSSTTGTDPDIGVDWEDGFLSADNFLMSGFAEGQASGPLVASAAFANAVHSAHVRPSTRPQYVTGAPGVSPGAYPNEAMGGGIHPSLAARQPYYPSAQGGFPGPADPRTHTHTHYAGGTQPSGAPVHVAAPGAAGSFDGEAGRKRGRDNDGGGDGDALPGGRVRRQAARAASAKLTAVLESTRSRGGDSDGSDEEDEDGTRRRSRRGAARGSVPSAALTALGLPAKANYSDAAESIMAAAAAEAHAKVMALDQAGAIPYDDDEDDEDDGGHGGRKGSDDRNSRSRERNRIHARKSRLRKKYFVDALKASLDNLEMENRRLRALLESKVGKPAETLLSDPAYNVPATSAPGGAAVAGAAPGAHSAGRTVLALPGQNPTSFLDHGDYALVEALSKAQQNFVVSDPNLPDNPIVFASAGFYQLTGYSPEEVIGRNCRFLQGPLTDPDTISVIRKGILEGRDTAVCLINYRKNGTPFWNSFFVAPLRGVDGRIVNFIGVQCEVTESVAQHLVAAQQTAQAKLLGHPFTALNRSATLPPPPPSMPPSAAADAARRSTGSSVRLT